MADKDKKRSPGRPVKVYERPDRIDATPEEIAEAVLAAPPKDKRDRRYIREAKQKKAKA